MGSQKMSSTSVPTKNEESCQFSPQDLAVFPTKPHRNSTSVSTPGVSKENLKVISSFAQHLLYHQSQNIR